MNRENRVKKKATGYLRHHRETKIRRFKDPMTRGEKCVLSVAQHFNTTYTRHKEVMVPSSGDGGDVNKDLLKDY